MDIRRLTETYAVSPQITPEDVAAIKAAGFTTIINNRPDGEIPVEAAPFVRLAMLDDLLNAARTGCTTADRSWPS